MFCFANDDWYLWSLVKWSPSCPSSLALVCVKALLTSRRFPLITCETALQFVVINLFFFSHFWVWSFQKERTMSRQPQKTGSLKFSRNELQFHSQTSKGLCAHWFNEYWDFFVLSHSISCLCHDISDQKLEYQFYSEWSELSLHFELTKVNQKSQKMVYFGEFLKTWVCSHTVLPDRSVLIGQKLVENVKISNASNAMFRVIFNFSLKKVGPEQIENYLP